MRSKKRNPPEFSKKILPGKNMASKTEVVAELLEIIDQQDKVIEQQKGLIAKLTNENLEQENMINVLMQEHCQQ